MRKTLIAVALGTAFVANISTADQATLDALIEAGIELTDEQAEVILNAEGDAISQAVAQLVQSAGDNAALAESIISAAVQVNPTLSDSIFTAVSAAAPDMVAVAASAVIEGQAPAAGVEAAAPPGLQTADQATGPDTTPPGLQTAAAATAATPAAQGGLARAATAPRAPGGGGTPSSPSN